MRGFRPSSSSMFSSVSKQAFSIGMCVLFKNMCLEEKKEGQQLNQIGMNDEIWRRGRGGWREIG